MTSALNTEKIDDAEKIWNALSRSCIEQLKTNGATEILNSIRELGLHEDKFVPFYDLDFRLRKYKWRLSSVTQFIDPRAFFFSLEKGILPVSKSMRSERALEFSVEPDYFHEAFGHAPLIVNDITRNFLGRFSKFASRCFDSPSDESYFKNIADAINLKGHGTSLFESASETSELVELSRLGWWTYESGVIFQNGGPKAWGAALISSPGELKSFMSKPVLPLTLGSILQTPFNPAEFQPQYFALSSFLQLDEILNEFEQRMNRRHEGITGCVLALNSLKPCQIHLSSSQSIVGKIIEISSPEIVVTTDASGTGARLKISDILNVEPYRDPNVT